jgi:hypothetical protein
LPRVLRERLRELLGQRIDQPGLALRQVERALQRLGEEDLAGLVRVLTIESRHLAWREIAKDD